MGKRVILCVAVVLIAMLTGPVGCQSMGPKTTRADEGDPSPLPWNSPASWEGQTFGIPY